MGNTHKVVFFNILPKNQNRPIIFKSLIISKTISKLKKLAVLFMLLNCLSAKGQINFFYNETITKPTPQVFSYFRDSSSNRTIDRFVAIRPQMQPMVTNNVNLTYKNEMLWLRISMANIENKEQLRYIMLRNPHINYLGCWIFSGDSLVKSFNPTGDHYLFSSRTIYHPAYVFPLPQTGVAYTSLLLLIDKRNEQLNIPIHLLTEEGFIKHNQQENLLAGIITGIGVLLFILNLFLYFKMKERLYIFYGLYVFVAFLYILCDFGLSFMFIFPNFYQAADLTRPLAISIAAPLYLLFGIQLLNVKKQMPVTYKWVMRYLGLYLLVLLSGIVLMRTYGTVRIVLLVLMQVFQNLNTLVTLAFAIMGLRKKIPFSGYIVASSIILMTTFFFFMNFVAGYIDDNFLSRNLMNIGFTLEIAILAFVLTLRFRDYKERSEALLRRVNLQQEQIFKNLTDYQEKDMLRISSLLHDSVGAGLSALRLNLESAQNDEKERALKIENSVKQITELANEVRRISHGLSPILLQKNGLVATLQSTIDNINSSNRLHIQFESIGTLQTISFRYEMLVYNVVQELIQNIIKHAGATEAIVQMMLEKELVAIYVEDNGKGFDETLIKDGLGFLQIKQLVKFVNGTLHIKAAVNSGTQVSIEFPVLADERTHKDTNSR